MNKFLMGAAVAALGCVMAPRAHAESVVLERSGLISGSESFVYQFDAPGAGTMTAKLTNLAWPERLSSLSFAASTATSVLTMLADAGSIQFSVSGPGAYYAHIAGTAGGALDVGLYSLRITFDSGISPVPLPGALPLLLAALASGAGLLRRRDTLASQSSATI
jgi:hypothetical protein